MKRSLLVFNLLIVLCLVTHFWGETLATNQTGIRVFDWEDLGVISLGIIAVAYQRKAGFPQLIHHSNRWWKPFLIGIAFAVADFLLYKLLVHPEEHSSLPPFTQPFPYSFLLYLSGGVYCEVIYRLLPLTLMMCICNKLFKKEYEKILFCQFIIITSLIEPLQQLQEGSICFVIYCFVNTFLFNVIQATYYKRTGFLASLTIRIGYYSIWHILFGVYIEIFELAY